jgi:hypothetical protein
MPGDGLPVAGQRQDDRMADDPPDLAGRTVEHRPAAGERAGEGVVGGDHVAGGHPRDAARAHLDAVDAGPAGRQIAVAGRPEARRQEQFGPVGARMSSDRGFQAGALVPHQPVVPQAPAAAAQAEIDRVGPVGGAGQEGPGRGGPVSGGTIVWRWHRRQSVASAARAGARIAAPE